MLIQTCHPKMYRPTCTKKKFLHIGSAKGSFHMWEIQRWLNESDGISEAMWDKFLKFYVLHVYRWKCFITSMMNIVMWVLANSLRKQGKYEINTITLVSLKTLFSGSPHLTPTPPPKPFLLIQCSKEEWNESIVASCSIGEAPLGACRAVDKHPVSNTELLP